MHDTNIKEKVLSYRRAGKSYSEIQQLVPISKSTLSLWLRNIKISKSKADLLLKKKLSVLSLNHKMSRQRKTTSLRNLIDEGRLEVQEKMKNPLFLLGVALYWAEGTKAFEQISFSNSDPEMIQCFLRWLKEIADVPSDKIKIQLHIHELHNQTEIEQYWSDITTIPSYQFTKTQIKKTSLGQRRNLLYYGTCNIRVHDIKLFRRFLGWKMGVIAQFSNIATKQDASNRIEALVNKYTAKR